MNYGHILVQFRRWCFEITFYFVNCGVQNLLSHLVLIVIFEWMLTGRNDINVSKFFKLPRHSTAAT